MNINHAEAGESPTPDDLEARLAEARSVAEAGDWALAERLYREMVAAGVRDVRAYCNLGVLALKENRSDAALDWLEQAVALANAWATALNQAPDSQGCQAVLLSPACASFDQYSDFEARGDHFRQLVQTLASEPSTQAPGPSVQA